MKNFFRRIREIWGAGDAIAKLQKELGTLRIDHDNFFESDKRHLAAGKEERMKKWNEVDCEIEWCKDQIRNHVVRKVFEDGRKERMEEYQKSVSKRFEEIDSIHRTFNDVFTALESYLGIKIDFEQVPDPNVSIPKIRKVVITKPLKK